MPLLKLLDSKNGSLQHNAAFALYGLADNEVKQTLNSNKRSCLDHGKTHYFKPKSINCYIFIFSLSHRIMCPILLG